MTPATTSDETPDETPGPTPATVHPAIPTPAEATGRRHFLRLASLAGFVLVATGLLTFGLLRYKQGHLTGIEWRVVTPEGGHCTLELLGRPSEDPNPGPEERRLVSEGWYSGVRTWVGWRELRPPLAELAGRADAWQHFRSVFEAERDRLTSRYGGVVTKDATIRFEDPLTWELRLEYPGGRLVQRAMVVAGGERPRLYFVGLAGRIDPDGEPARRLFASFRLLP